jgi:hypothetical protein
MRNFEQNTLPLEIVLQSGRVMTPDEAKYPECWRSLSLEQFDPDLLCHSAFVRTKDEQDVDPFLNQPVAIVGVLDPHSPVADETVPIPSWNQQDFVLKVLSRPQQ